MRFKIPSHGLSLFKIIKPHWPGVHPTPQMLPVVHPKLLATKKNVLLIQHFKNNQWYWGGPWVMFRIFNHQLKLSPRASSEARVKSFGCWIVGYGGRGLIMRDYWELQAGVRNHPTQKSPSIQQWGTPVPVSDTFQSWRSIKLTGVLHEGRR